MKTARKFEATGGSQQIQAVRYRAKPIEFDKGKTAIIVTSFGVLREMRSPAFTPSIRVSSIATS